MNDLTPILNIAFLIIVALFGMTALLAVYILIKYGRSKSIAVFSSIAFGALFVLLTISAFTTLQLGL